LAGRGVRTVNTVEYDTGLPTRPLYSYAEADRLAKVTPGTSRRWAKGYKYWNEWGEHVSQPPITPGREDESEEGVSFFDLIGIKAIDGLRRAGFGLPTIRKVVAYCKNELGVEYPLVTYRFKVDRRHIFVEEGEGRLLNVLGERGMQAWDAILDPFLETIEYQNDFARRWWPLGKDDVVVVNPAYAFGSPVIWGSGVRTELVAERAEVGDAPEVIAYDFHLTPQQVESALLFENQLAA
jgi:uncharacterized protein (DUF433 family)